MKRSSAEHDAPMTKESIDQAIKEAIERALENHRPKTDPTVIATIILSSISVLLVLIGGWMHEQNRIAIIEERQTVNAGLILKLAEKIEKVDELERNNESAVTQTGQIISDHIAMDDERWKRIGGKREKQ